jgi:hypothetical protein
MTYGDGREVYINILAPIVGSDEAKALRFVEPLDLAFDVCGGECETQGTCREGDVDEEHLVCLSRLCVCLLNSWRGICSLGIVMSDGD